MVGGHKPNEHIDKIWMDRIWVDDITLTDKHAKHKLKNRRRSLGKRRDGASKTEKTGKRVKNYDV